MMMKAKVGKKGCRREERSISEGGSGDKESRKVVRSVVMPDVSGADRSLRYEKL